MPDWQKKHRYVEVLIGKALRSQTGDRIFPSTSKNTTMIMENSCIAT